MAKEIKNNKKVRYYTKWNDHLYMALVHVLCAVSVVCILVPLIFVVAASFSSPKALLSGKVYLWPVDFTLRGYNMLLGHKLLISGFLNSILYTVVGTVINVVMTVLAAYPLSKKNLIGGGVIMTLFVMTMYLHPGVIPTYLNVRDFGLINKVWALIIPGALSAYNMIIMCNAFRGIDSAIYEAATIDGCSQFRTLTSVALPLVYPTIATLGLFYAVGRWNGINDVMYYINDSTLYTVQMVLKQFIESVTVSVEEGINTNLVAENIKAASIVISMLPMLIVYPFVQKFFTKGIMVGAVKG